MTLTKPGGEIAVVHTLKFTDAAQGNEIHKYANGADGLTIARGTESNRFVAPGNSVANEGTV